MIESDESEGFTSMSHGPRRILVFGGTFDPPHRAHIELPRAAARRLNCDRILYVPARANPLKQDVPPPTAAEHRLAMLDLALADVPEAQVSTIELDRPPPSYTVDTLEELRRIHAEPCDFRLLIGADQALAFHAWKDWRRILELAVPAVMLRPPWDAAAFARELATRFDAAEADQWLRWVVPTPAMDVSATEVRRRLAANEDTAPLLAPAVAAYIRKNHLYQTAHAT
jgi:nicotinate-nucleotide adenylyltransferase